MSPGTHADLIVRNARISTLDDRGREGTALAVREGRFVDVGTDAEVMRYRGEQTQVIDAGGRRIIPGLNDSHIHLIRGGLNYHLELRWDGVRSLADALRMLKEQALARRRRNGCGSLEAGASSSSPSAVCQAFERSMRRRPTRQCSCCTSTIARGSTVPLRAVGAHATRQTLPAQ